MKNLFKPSMLTGAVLMLASCGGEIQTAAQPQIAATTTTSKQSAAQQLSASDYHDVVQKIYVGYFGRPADPAGLAFFANRLLALNAPATIEGIRDAYQSNNEDIKAVVNVFGNSQESADLYPGTNGEFMDAVYLNLFARPADIAGKAYWVNALDLGLITRAGAAVNLMAGAQSSDITIVSKKATVAAYFTTSLASSVQKSAYDGLAANAVARNMLSGVAGGTDTTAYQANVANTITSLVGTLPPAGLYFGKLGGGGLLYQAMVLENGQYFGLYSRSAVGHFAPAGLLQGTGSVSNGQFSSSDIRDLNPQPYNSFSYTGALVPQTSLDGSVTNSGGSIAITHASTPPTAYDFNVAANNADIAGAWTLADVDGASVTASLSGTAISGTASNCSFSGTLKPRATGKNVFDAAITYGVRSSGTTCRLENQAASGVAYTYLADEGATRQLIIAVTNAGRTTGNVLQGVKVLPAGIAPAFTMTDTVVGSGTVATAGRIVTVHYTGWLYNATSPNQRSTKFDSSVDLGTPFEFTLGAGRVIAGWDQGVAGMRVGGKRILVIPAELGYGATGAGATIAPNASLVFEVEVLGVR